MSFTKIHLKLEQDNFKSTAFGTIQEEEAVYSRFFDLMKRVGGASNWHKRQKFQNEKSLLQLKSVFNEEPSRLWIFKKDKVEVGFCQVASITNISSIFNNASCIAEIYKIGLFPDYVGKGLGKHFVSSVARELFKDNHTIYLNTRNTNVVNSIPFYQKLGFEVFKTEILPDDLVL